MATEAEYDHLLDLSIDQILASEFVLKQTRGINLDPVNPEEEKKENGEGLSLRAQLVRKVMAESQVEHISAGFSKSGKQSSGEKDVAARLSRELAAQGVHVFSL